MKQTPIQISNVIFQKPAFRSRVRKRLAQFQNNRVIPKGERAAVEGRRHRDMQTDKWLEEIKDRVPEVEIGVQGWRAKSGGL